jgi:hypothetical protein
MAQELDIKRCWYHSSRGRRPLAHYDIPLLRIAEIKQKCEVISSRKLIEIIKGS